MCALRERERERHDAMRKRSSYLGYFSLYGVARMGCKEGLDIGHHPRICDVVKNRPHRA